MHGIWFQLMWKPRPCILRCSQRKSIAAYLKLLNLSAGNILTAHLERMCQQAMVCLSFFLSLFLFVYPHAVFF